MPITQWSDSIVIAEMNDEPAFSDDMSALMHRLDEGPDAAPHVVVDMRAVSYLNSSNIAQLLRLRKKLHAGHRRLRICCIADTVWSELLITGLDKVFDFTDDVATSLASLQLE